LGCSAAGGKNSVPTLSFNYTKCKDFTNIKFVYVRHKLF